MLRAAERADLTKMTQSGHRRDRNPAVQQSPAVPRCATLSVEAREPLAVKRREFMALIGGAAVTWPLCARAQQAGELPTLGVVFGGPPSRFRPWAYGFFD